MREEWEGGGDGMRVGGDGMVCVCTVMESSTSMAYLAFFIVWTVIFMARRDEGAGG